MSAAGIGHSVGDGQEVAWPNRVAAEPNVGWDQIRAIKSCGSERGSIAGSESEGCHREQKKQNRLARKHAHEGAGVHMIALQTEP